MRSRDRLLAPGLGRGVDRAEVEAHRLQQVPGQAALGRAVELGAADALCRSPLHPYTRALIASVPLPDPRAERARVQLPLLGDVPSPSSPPSGCAFHPRCPVAIARCRQEAPALLSVATEAGEGQRQVACHLIDGPAR